MTGMDIRHDPDDPRDLRENITPVSPEEFIGALADPEPLVRVTLVPVEHFGADEEHCECGRVVECGMGLMDAVSAWSDCNRAIGRIYRVDDLPQHREPGDTITVYVPQSEVAKFGKRFGDDAGHRCPACHVPYSDLPEGHRVSRPTCTGSADASGR